MFAFERQWAVAVLEGFAPVGGPGLAPREGEVDYLTTIQKMMLASTGKAAFGLRVGLWIVAFAPMWLFGRLRTVRDLSRERRAELLDQLLAHRFFLVRELTLLLKLSACMAMFARPSIRDRSSYDRPGGLDYDAIEESGERPKMRLPVVEEGTSGQEVA